MSLVSTQMELEKLDLLILSIAGQVVD
jgi:hypothetical protein